MLTHIHIIDTNKKEHLIKVSDLRNISHNRGKRFRVIFDCPWYEYGSKNERSTSTGLGCLTIYQSEFDKIKNLFEIHSMSILE